jgi:hypothetical protein
VIERERGEKKKCVCGGEKETFLCVCMGERGIKVKSLCAKQCVRKTEREKLRIEMPLTLEVGAFDVLRITGFSNSFVPSKVSSKLELNRQTF